MYAKSGTPGSGGTEKSLIRDRLWLHKSRSEKFVPTEFRDRHPKHSTPISRELRIQAIAGDETESKVEEENSSPTFRFHNL
jgi:hypothetical protein